MLTKKYLRYGGAIDYLIFLCSNYLLTCLIKPMGTFVCTQVRGCGKDRGLQLILDSQKMLSALPQNTTTVGYRVLITLNGVVTSNLAYHVAPDFDGEHNFYLHGIHYIVV